MSTLSGRYFATGSSAAVDATVAGNADNIEVRINGERVAELLILEAVSDRVGSVPRKIRFTDGSTFECPDNDAVDAFFDHGDSFFSRLTRAEGSWKIVTMAAIASVVLLVGIFRYGLPVMASGAAAITPPVVMTLIDSGTLDTVDRVLFSESKLEEDRKTELSAIFKELVDISGDTEPPLNLLFRDGGFLGANAIALPGGTVILTDQLVELAEHDDEIAGVLAHEIGHVEHRHSLKQIYRVLGVAFMVSLVAGDSGQIVEEVVSQATALESLSYSRAFETESDEHSVEIMLEAGRNPLAFVDLLDRIIPGQEKEGDTGWLSTHPGTGDRRANVSTYMESLK